MDFSAKAGDVADFLYLGEIIDEDNDSFEVRIKSTDAQFLSEPEIQGNSHVYIDLDHYEVQRHGNRVYSITVEVIEYYGTITDIVRSRTEYPIKLEIKGVDPNFIHKDGSQSTKVHPSMTLDKINSFGELVIRFNQTMIAPKNWTAINGTDLDVSIKAFNEDF